MEPDPPGQSPFAFRPGQGIDALGQGAAIDAAAGLDCGDTEGRGQVALARARRTGEVQRLGTADELQPGKRHDAVTVRRRLEREVEAFGRLDRREPGRAQAGPDAASFAQGQLLCQQGVDRLDRAHLALFQAAEDMVQPFQGGAPCAGRPGSGGCVP